jgi:hypothetical protein
MEELLLPGFEKPAAPREPTLDTLRERFASAAFFDIETDGLEAGSRVTMIACLIGTRLEVFTHGRDLDRFLLRVEAVDLLVSFNGRSFDIPRLLNAFHLPSLGRDHLDLRPVCRAAGHKGGLKQIEKHLGIHRPPDITGVSGEDAQWMWRAWEKDGDAGLRDRVVRYCAADVVALRLLAARLLDIPAGMDFTILDRLVVSHEPVVTPATVAPAAVDAHYERLRIRARALQMGQGAASQPRAGQNARP